MPEDCNDWRTSPDLDAHIVEIVQAEDCTYSTATRILVAEWDKERLQRKLSDIHHSLEYDARRVGQLYKIHALLAETGFRK